MVYIGKLYAMHPLGKFVLTVIQARVTCKWTTDIQQLLLEHFEIICSSPSHIYHSALVLSPSSSWLHKYYSTELLQQVRVVKGLQAGWGIWSCTVLLDNGPLALSYWNNTIGVGSVGGDIIILDVIIGKQTAVLSGHTHEVNSLTFLSDGLSIVSGSNDHTIKLWDIQTGGVIRTFHGHTKQVQSVSISVDCTRIALGSQDETIRLWDIQTGECYHIINQQANLYYASFSPTDLQHLIFISEGKIYWQNINDDHIIHKYDGSYAAFSLDGAQVVLCNGEVVTVQNSDSGAIITKFHVANGNTKHFCFFP